MWHTWDVTAAGEILGLRWPVVPYGEAERAAGSAGVRDRDGSWPPQHSPLQPHSKPRRRMRGAGSIARRASSGAGQQQGLVFLPFLLPGSERRRPGLSPSVRQPRPQPFLSSAGTAPASTGPGASANFQPEGYFQREVSDFLPSSAFAQQPSPHLRAVLGAPGGPLASRVLAWLQGPPSPPPGSPAPAPAPRDMAEIPVLPGLCCSPWKTSPFHTSSTHRWNEPPWGWLGTCLSGRDGLGMRAHGRNLSPSPVCPETGGLERCIPQAGGVPARLGCCSAGPQTAFIPRTGSFWGVKVGFIV